MAVDTTPIEAIYDKLNQVTAFHPASTEIFDDFLQEAGDIVTMFSGTASFDFPIFAQHMTWNGSMLTTMESTGNKQRNALPPLQRRQKNGSYGAGQRVTEQGVKYETEFIKTNKVIGMEARAMGVLLDENGNPVVDPNNPDEFVWDTTSSTGAKIYSNLSLTANRASLISAINDVSGTQISGSKIDLSAQGTVLVQAINSRNPSSTLIKLDAAQIELSGYVTATTLDTRLLNADQLFSSTGYTGTIISTTGKINDLTVGTLRMTTSGQSSETIARKGVNFAGTLLTDLRLLGVGSDSALVIPDAVSNLQILFNSSTNIYTLQKKTYSSSTWADVGTFSRATSLSGAWSGSTYTVTASPQGNTHPVSVSLFIGSTWDYDDTLDKYQKTVQIRSGTHVVATDYIDKPSPKLQSKTATSNGTVTPDSDYEGLSSVVVNVSSGGSYDDGWNALIAACGGSSSSSYVQYGNATSATASPDKESQRINGWIWLKNTSGQWVRTRNIPVSHTPSATDVKTFSPNADALGYRVNGNWFTLGRNTAYLIS